MVCGLLIAMAVAVLVSCRDDDIGPASSIIDEPRTAATISTIPLYWNSVPDRRGFHWVTFPKNS